MEDIINKLHNDLVLPLVFAPSQLAVFVLSTPVFAPDEAPIPDAPPTDVITKAGLIPQVNQTAETPVEVSSEASQAPAEGALNDLAPVFDAVADADLTLMDPSGEPLTLVSEKTAQIHASTDSYFTGGLVTSNFSSIELRLNVVSDLPSTNRQSSGG